MGLRRNAGCDQRRRRVLLEEKRGGSNSPKRSASAASAKSAARSEGRAYTEAALAGRQPPVIAVLAARAWTLTVVFLVALAAVVGLHAAYGQLYLLPVTMRPVQMQALDVESAGNLVAWLSAILLAAAAFQGVQIHRLRRHKADDYRGRYRVWVWIPAVLFLISACVATGLRADLAALIASLVDASGAAEHIRLSPIGACLLWTLVAVRLAFEVRDSRGSLTALAVGTCCYFIAAASLVVDLPATSHVLVVMAWSSAAAVGHLCVFLTIAVFGRFVYLQSQGLLQQSSKSRKKVKAAGKAVSKKSKPQPKRQQPARADAEDESQTAKRTRDRARKNVRTDEPAEEQSGGVINLETARRSQSADESLQDQPEAGSRKLSKAERRRQRKLKRQQRRAA